MEITELWKAIFLKIYNKRAREKGFLKNSWSKRSKKVKNITYFFKKYLKKLYFMEIFCKI